MARFAWVAGATLLATGTLANAADPVAFGAIRAGEFATAVQRLEAERRIHPQRPELMLNLAYAYHRLNRTAEARALYARALQAQAVTMDLPDGRIRSSQDLAAAALAALAPAVAAR